MNTVLTRPALSGTSFRGGFRLWTAAHGVAWDEMRAVPGAARVTTVDGWHVSTDELCPVLSSPAVVAAYGSLVELGVWRGDARAPERHELDGRMFVSTEEARRAAFEAGALAFQVFEDDAARLGLGGGSDV